MRVSIRAATTTPAALRTRLGTRVCHTPITTSAALGTTTAILRTTRAATI